MRSLQTHGAELVPGGGVRFRLWAPAAAEVGLALDPAKPGASAPAGPVLRMQATRAGWHELHVSDARAGTRYWFVLPNGLHVPDPASRFQPEDVHGPSEVVDPAFDWHDAQWRGRPWHESVIYELHVGTFTAAGTFRAAMARLDHLVALGITAVELMPVADFPGRRNWGYDGVLWYAPDATYGRPQDLKAFIDAAHGCGIMVFLDVVYNHFGPDGNYLSAYAPAFFHDRRHTPWGVAINFDGPASAEVREFVLQNAVYWLEEFHFDGLRLDAVHAIVDDGATHLLNELTMRVQHRRHVHLILENEANQVHRLARDSADVPLQFTAQWNDDVHHVLHVAATREQTGYYADYCGMTHLLGRALAEGFAFQGELMPFRGAPRGEPSESLPPVAFVAFLQNHDQIGNRARGERLTALAPPEVVRAMATVLLLLPQIPMLFMGEEWGSTRPFAFFCDFGDALAAAVRDGRRAEFAQYPEFQNAAQRNEIPDPQADTTFAAAHLDWQQLQQPQPAAVLQWYQQVLAVRRDVIVPLLPRFGAHSGRYQVIGDGAVLVSWHAADEDHPVLTLAANLSDQSVVGFPHALGRTLWQQGNPPIDGTAAPWSVRWSLTS